MAWFYNTVSGELTSASGVTALPYDLQILGWHELKIPASDSEAQAAAAAQAEYPGSKTPTTSLSKGLGQGAGTIGATAAGDVLGLPTLTNTRDFASRAVRVVIGIGLVIVGLNIIGKSAGVSLPKVIPV